MFVYEKKLQYPVKIKNPNPRLAAAIISQYGGPDGELGASLRYLSQRYSMPYPELKGLLTDIGTEELGHLEMVGTIVHQLTRNLTEEQIKEAGFEAYFVDHTTGVFPQFASGYPWSASTMQVTGDTIADLTDEAPPTISLISVVIEAWRTRLYVRVRVEMIAVAFSVAECMALRRAPCSAAAESIRAW